MKTSRILMTLWLAFVLLMPLGALSAGLEKPKDCCHKRAECQCCFQPASAAVPQAAVLTAPSAASEVVAAPVSEIISTSGLDTTCFPASTSSAQLLAADAKRHRLIYQRLCSLLL